MVLLHHVRILFLFSSSPTSRPDTFFFQWFSDIMFRSPIFSVVLRHRVRILFLFSGSPISCPNTHFLFNDSLTLHLNPLSFQRLSIIVFGFSLFLTALRHHARIPFYFRWLSGIVSESPIFSAALQHHFWILFLFSGSLTSDPNPLLFFTALQHRV